MDQAGMRPEEEMSLGDSEGRGGGPEPEEDLSAFKDFVEGLDLDSLLGTP